MEKLKELWTRTGRALNKAVLGEEFVADLGALSLVGGGRFRFELVRTRERLRLKYHLKVGFEEWHVGYMSLAEVTALRSILEGALRQAKEPASGA
jgi:hypothetical protein